MVPICLLVVCWLLLVVVGCCWLLLVVVGCWLLVVVVVVVVYCCFEMVNFPQVMVKHLEKNMMGCAQTVRVTSLLRFDKNREDLWRVLRFMQWYLKKYGVDVGKKKKAAAQKEEKQDMGRGRLDSWICNEISTIEAPTFRKTMVWEVFFFLRRYIFIEWFSSDFFSVENLQKHLWR